MEMRLRLFLPLLLTAIVVFSVIIVRLSHNRPDYNVILISIDTLRADHLGCYGYHKDTSPNIDEFAKESLFFENPYSTTAWTFPSHFSMFTARYPNSNNLLIYPAVKAFDDSYLTLAEILKSSGYQTVAFTGGGWVAEDLGFGQGFDSYVTHGRRFEHNQEALFTWIAEHACERKFFLFIHGFNTHRPYIPPRHLKSQFIRDIDIPAECRGITFASKQPGRAECLESEKGIIYMHSQYDAEIFYVDIMMKQLFDELRKHNLYENSIIIITSDHGEELFDHGRFDHVKTLYEELIKVPLIMRVPNSRPNGVKARVSNLDLLPTLLDILEIPYAAGDIHGTSMKAFLTEGRHDSDIYTSTGMTGEGAIDFEGAPFVVLSVIRNDIKLIIKAKQDESETYELYDLENDPLERENLVEAPDYKAAVRSLKMLIKEWGDRIDMNLRLYEMEGSEGELSPETLKQLKSLGYLN